jgi:hypothetical protein
VTEADTGLYHQWNVILRAKETKVKRFQGKKLVVSVEHTVLAWYQACSGLRYD